MNPAISMPRGMGAINVGEMLAVPGFASEKSKATKSLPKGVNALISNVLATLHQIVVYAIERRTAAEFLAARDEMFPQYFDAALGLSYLVRVIVPKHILEVLSSESFSEMEAEFRESGLAAFGTEVRDQAIFTAWTLRKISDICQQIDKAPLSTALRREDSDIFDQFVFYAMRTRFSLDCLSKSMSCQKPIYPEVLPIILDGLRSAVNSYACARRALDLRVPQLEPQIAAVEWDDEDAQLLREATFDVLGEPA
jgi:hypothetical protein